MKGEQVIVERKDGVTLYGRIIDNKGRIGLFEVEHRVLGNNGSVFTTYPEAQRRMKALIGTKDNKS